ncbi:MAG: DUF2141 domain-containing protein [Myxococcota bacterium]|nr:DUF2141 domain-containing protein [Myxococcota bacterium]
MSNRGVWLSVALAVWLGCETAGSSGAESAGTPGAVQGEVHYEGNRQGPLKIAVFASFPPRGAPVAYQEFTAPVFPQPFVVRGVPAGRYFVLAVLDVNQGDGDRFRPAVDPGGASGSLTAPMPITVDAIGGFTGVRIDLLDPGD